MEIDVKAPAVGESVAEVSILQWNVNDGDVVSVGQKILEIESDKATVEIVAENEGKIKVLKNAGEMIPVGSVIAKIDDTVKSSGQPREETKKEAPKEVAPSPEAKKEPQAAKTNGSGGEKIQPLANTGLSPSKRKEAIEKGLKPEQVAKSSSSTTGQRAPGEGEKRVPMSMLRQRIAERLLQAQSQAAILTTFNEVDLTEVMKVRKEKKDAFKQKHGASLGFMSFFTRACVEALKESPAVNAYIDGKEIVYHDYCDIGVAVGTERGLVVPVLRGAENLSFSGVEKGILALAEKAKAGKLSIQELTGGTFTISNGGVYGSLLSTPILNPPQSAILGMHNIVERPIVVDGQIQIRPMMYLALSYDHRIIDGKEAVTFLIHIKKSLENPSSLGEID